MPNARKRVAGVVTAGLAALASAVLAPTPASATVSTTTLTAVADTYADSGSPNAGHGTTSDLRIRQSTRITYVRFTIPADAGTISAASLQLYGLRSCSVNASIGPVSATWSETSLTWNNRPAVGGSIAGFAPRSSAGWSTASVLSAVPASGTVSFGIVAASSGACSYASRERSAKQAPRLMLTRTAPDPTPSATATTASPTATATATTTPTPTATATATATPTATATATASPSPTATPPPPPADPVIAAVGDLACDPTDQNYNGGVGQGSYCRTADVANLVASMSPTALLALGDLQYEDGTLAKFQSSYAPAWSRFDSIVRPVVGNHEYLDPGAAGYFSYFGAKAGDPTQGWYSFDIGTWHVIVLNGECSSVAGGCAAGSPQETWLKADLASSTAACTMAVWHRPRFTSGEAQSATTPQGQATFWADLYAAGADVVLGGHIHNYERFAPIKGDGTADPARGLRQFVVGTGGKSLVGFNATTWPTSEFRDSTNYGALRMVLRPSGYDWQFLPIGGGAPIDAGSQSCH